MLKPAIYLHQSNSKMKYQQQVTCRQRFTVILELKRQNPKLEKNTSKQDVFEIISIHIYFAKVCFYSKKKKVKWSISGSKLRFAAVYMLWVFLVFCQVQFKEHNHIFLCLFEMSKFHQRNLKLSWNPIHEAISVAFFVSLLSYCLTICENSFNVVILWNTVHIWFDFIAVHLALFSSRQSASSSKMSCIHFCTQHVDMMKCT